MAKNPDLKVEKKRKNGKKTQKNLAKIAKKLEKIAKKFRKKISKILGHFTLGGSPPPKIYFF